MTSVIVSPVEENANGFKPFYWGSSVSVSKKDGSALTVEEALAAGGLNFEVGLFPSGAHVKVPGSPPRFIRDPKGFKTVRLDTMEILGSVGKVYRVLQNHEALAFANDLLDSGEAVIEVVGSSHGGAKVWVVCRIVGTGMTVGGIDESITPYMTLITDHAGHGSVTVVVSPVRPPCSNLLNFTVKNASNVFRVRHTPTTKDRLSITSGREALGLTIEYMGEFERAMADLLASRVSEKQFDSFLDQLVPIPEPKLNSDGTPKPHKGVTDALAKQEDIRSIYYGSDNLNNIRGTRYGVLQSVVEHYQHNTPGRVTAGRGDDPEQIMAENRTTRLLQGVGLGQEAWNLLTV